MQRREKNTLRMIRASSVYWTSILVIVVKFEFSSTDIDWPGSAPKDLSSSGVVGASGLSDLFSMVILWIFVSNKDSYFLSKKVFTSVLMDCFTK